MSMFEQLRVLVFHRIDGGLLDRDRRVRVDLVQHGLDHHWLIVCSIDEVVHAMDQVIAVITDSVCVRESPQWAGDRMRVKRNVCEDRCWVVIAWSRVAHEEVDGNAKVYRLRAEQSWILNRASFDPIDIT